LNKSAINLGKNVSICGQGWIFGRGKLHIGDNTWVSPRVLFYTHLYAHISIGNNCDIGPGVNFVVGSHEVSISSERRAGIGMANSISIGNGCWIGTGAIILDGVTIDDGCVIGAGSIVTKNVKKNSLAAGVPAVIKKEFD
jgi:maltose O-acetyltransferase